jgi:undecaprenyl-diphosphatase
VIGWVEAVVLGVLQGLTEFLPISSTGHLLIAGTAFGWGDPGAAFTAVTQLGTLAAVLLYFRADIMRIVGTWTRSLYQPGLRGDISAREGWYVILGTIPIVVLGVAFSHEIETVARDLRLVAAMFIGVGLVLAVADHTGARVRTLNDLTLKDGILFGLAQACALIPGVSRSGATISAGLFMGYSREAATRYSFLLSIPAVALSGLYEATKIGDSGEQVSWGPTLLATGIAFVVGYAVIAWLLRYVSSHSFRIFVIYRVAMGVFILVMVATGSWAATS